MINYYNEKIVILGLGMTGLSCVNFFISKGVIPRVIDINFKPLNLIYLPKNIPYHLGSYNIEWLLNATLIVISPGISLSNSILDKISHIKIIGDIELFSHEISKPVIAITGSNGKSTVTNMIGEISACAGLKVGLGGNIGRPALQLLNKNYDLYILELSSFQLEKTYNLNPLVATILNISEDHMDRYPYGFKQYLSTKLKIYNNAKICIINNNDIYTIPNSIYNTRYISFGIDQGNYYLKKDKNTIWLMSHGTALLDCSEMIVSGLCNYINALAALAISEAIGISKDISLMALKNFRGLSHRYELIYKCCNICWINDSKATNVGSTKSALENLSEFTGVLHLLLGGEGKSADFTVLLPYLQNRKLKIYCYGKDNIILGALRPEITTIVDTIEQAIYIINTKLQQGDIVLLSPACSSLDQFSNFEERGLMFTRLVHDTHKCNY